MIVVTPSVAPEWHWRLALGRWVFIDEPTQFYFARYSNGPSALASCPLHAAWQAIVAAAGGGA